MSKDLKSFGITSRESSNLSSGTNIKWEIPKQAKSPINEDKQKQEITLERLRAKYTRRNKYRWMQMFHNLAVWMGFASDKTSQ